MDNFMNHQVWKIISKFAPFLACKNLTSCTFIFGVAIIFVGISYRHKKAVLDVIADPTEVKKIAVGYHPNNTYYPIYINIDGRLTPVHCHIYKNTGRDILTSKLAKMNKAK